MWHRMCRSEKRWSTCRRGEKELGDLLYLRDSEREREREREWQNERNYQNIPRGGKYRHAGLNVEHAF